MDAQVTQLQQGFVILTNLVSEVATIVTGLRSGAIDPADEAALVNLNTQLATIDGALQNIVTPPAATGTSGTSGATGANGTTGP